MKKVIKTIELSASRFFVGASGLEVRCNVRFDTDMGMNNQSVGVALAVTPEIEAAISNALNQCKAHLEEGGWEVIEAATDE